MQSIEQKYQKLDEISHVLLRPSRYLGSTVPHTGVSWICDDVSKIKFTKREITWCPAFLKIFDEIISNSVDFSKKPEGKHLDTIKVDFDVETGEISVYDNGGIVVVKHKEHDQYIPEMIFELRSGSNFDDSIESTVSGTHGEGSSLTRIFSKYFFVSTADGKNRFEQTHSNNGRDRTPPNVRPSTNNFTKISFIPDYDRFGMTTINSDDNYSKLVKRVIDVAACNPNLKVYLNGNRIKIGSFEDYVKMYVDEYVFDSNDDWKVAVAKSDDGFSHVSFVNGTETTTGGQHVSYVVDQIVNLLREYFKKKHKIDVKPSEIKNHLALFVSSTIVRPKFSSQTKEDMITEVRNFGTSFDITDKFINKLVKSSIIQSILDWVYAKETAQKNAELRKLNKDLDKTNLRKIVKFTDASNKNDRKNCMLAICEGDSAANAVLSARTEMIGCYPLKGKPINAMGATAKDLLANKEFVDLMLVTGLKIGQRVNSLNDLRFGKIVMMTDADPDGAGHIQGLLCAMLKKFWPELFSLGAVYRFTTPIAKIEVDKKELYFYSLDEFNKWVDTNKSKKFTSRYLKGLGSSTAKDFKKYFENMDKHLVQITIDDVSDLEIVDLVFGKEAGAADKRKVWLDLEQTVDAVA